VFQTAAASEREIPAQVARIEFRSERDTCWHWRASPTASPICGPLAASGRSLTLPTTYVKRLNQSPTGDSWPAKRNGHRAISREPSSSEGATVRSVRYERTAGGDRFNALDGKLPSLTPEGLTGLDALTPISRRSRSLG